ncbi:alpha/beta-hydrolase [Xylariaceae sp. FL1019]|nr:alpha/beta-hydrolase [Xylariaceae sp. FL1019]
MAASTSVTSLQLPDSRALSYDVTAPSTDKARPYVLLASPLCAPLATWDHVVPELVSQGFNVLRFDQPGHGSSGVPADLSTTTFESMADDVHHLLKHLQIEKLYAWIGVSMGAATGIVYAAKYPGVIERLVPCDTISSSPVNAGTDDAFGPRVAVAREAGNLDASVEGTMERWFGRSWMETNVSESERMRKLMRSTSVDGFETCCAALRSKTFDLRPLVTKAGAGVKSALLVVGANDANLPQSMQELRKGIEDGLKSKQGESVSVELKVIENAGHVLFIDGFTDFIKIITQFLA